MAKTKRRTSGEQVSESPETDSEQGGVVVVPADDRTAIDDLEERKKGEARTKREKEKIPEGFKKRLPAGVVRKIKVNKTEIDEPDGRPYRITEPDGTETDYDNVEIEGKSRMRITREVLPGCETRGSCHIETEASVLVGRARKVPSKE